MPPDPLMVAAQPFISRWETAEMRGVFTSWYFGGRLAGERCGRQIAQPDSTVGEQPWGLPAQRDGIQNDRFGCEVLNTHLRQARES